ncbi:unnamed protein product [Timema podura]|uniref:Uncharacterized protein n=1 Tax=Timema podura TaxID=61482 RepID=A0ABN7NZD4_TIMPD|nr:unnamed protein product [Timema podura]
MGGLLDLQEQGKNIEQSKGSQKQQSVRFEECPHVSYPHLKSSFDATGEILTRGGSQRSVMRNILVFATKLQVPVQITRIIRRQGYVTVNSTRLCSPHSPTTKPNPQMFVNFLFRQCRVTGTSEMLRDYLTIANLAMLYSNS